MLNWGRRRDVTCSDFLKTFPNYSVYSEPKPTDEAEDGVWVFCSKDEASSADIATYAKINKAFSMVESILGLIIQLWVPVRTDGGQVRHFSTSGQPFAVSNLHTGFEEYRNRECGDINVPPTSAFRTDMSELLLGESVELFGIWASYMVPIRCPQNSYFEGVVECSAVTCADLEFVNTMNTALKEAGLYISEGQEYIPNIYRPVANGIQEALRRVCQSSKLSLAQVWVPYINPSFTKWALKLTGASHERILSFKEYFDACGTVLLKHGEELVVKTLQDNKPRFCDTISELGRDKRMRWARLHTSNRTKWRSFTICLIREVPNGEDLQYAFEFIWRNQPDYAKVLPKLLLTLKEHLPPRFKYPSGGKLGDELDIEYVVTSPNSETVNFKIFQDTISESQGLNYVMADEEIDEMADECEIVFLKVIIGEDTIKFPVNKSLATVESFEMEIIKRSFDPGYELMYQDKDKAWKTINSDEDLKECIATKSTTTASGRKVVELHIFYAN